MISKTLCLSTAALLALNFARAAAVQAPATGRQFGGRFLLYTIGARCGEEIDSFQDAPAQIIVSSLLQCTDWNGKSRIESAIHLNPDLTPAALNIHVLLPAGTPRLAKDISIRVNGNVASLGSSEGLRKVAAPRIFFTITPHAPAVARIMLIRYWFTHGRPRVLPILPEGNVTIEPHGGETVLINGKIFRLNAYSIQGLGWGREWLWMDSKQRLIALVSHKVGNDGLTEEPFESVLMGYESALPEFASRAARYTEAALERAAHPFCAKPNTLAIIGATLIDGLGGQPVTDSAVVAEGGRVFAAGSRSAVKVPRGAQLIDGRGKYLLPGLWDMHVHAFWPDYGAACLAGGVTTARDCANEPAMIVAMRDSIRAGRGVGPRFLLMGSTQDVAPGEWAFDAPVRTPDEAREVVKRFKDAGYEQIKIFESVKPEILSVITAEAHRRSMTVAGHIPNGLDARQAVEAGMDGIEHIMYLNRVMPGNAAEGPESVTNNDPWLGMLLAAPEVEPASPALEDSIRFFRERGTVIDPTMVAWERSWHDRTRPLQKFIPGAEKAPAELVRPQATLGLPPDQAKVFRAAFDRELKMINALHRGGVTLVAGTDARIPAYELYRELELFVEAGFTPMEAIQAATVVPARAMKLDAEVGSVEPGKRADLIILDRNPLENISNIRSIKTVITGGRIYSCAPLWRIAGFKL